MWHLLVKGQWRWCHRYPCMFLGGGGERTGDDWCERSCGGMRQRGYQFVEGFLCPISNVRGQVPRVLTLVTSLAPSLPGDPGPGVFITLPHWHIHIYYAPIPPPIQLPSWRKTKLPQPFLSQNICPNWMHIHTVMHDDPSVDFCLTVKNCYVLPNLSKSSFLAMSCSVFWPISHVFY